MAGGGRRKPVSHPVPGVVAEALRERLRRSTLSISELGRRTGISRITLSRFIHGKTDLTISRLESVAIELGFAEEVADAIRGESVRTYTKPPISRAAASRTPPGHDGKSAPGTDGHAQSRRTSRPRRAPRPR